jgi:hypothetical protein
MKLSKRLAMVSAEILQNTHMVPENLKFKLDLMERAYGAKNLVIDFRTWCEENRDASPRYPIVEYVKVVDTRLGRAPATPRPDPANPAVEEIRSVTYELTNNLPSKEPIAKLLLTFTSTEILDALREFVEYLTEADTPHALRRFFTEGGAGAVILARRRRNAHVS